jgi:hypothetical protein
MGLLHEIMPGGGIRRLNSGASHEEAGRKNLLAAQKAIE